MIVNSKTGEEVVVDGESNVKKATISQESLGKLQYILTKGLYTDPISAVIVEMTNNGVDGVVQAKKNPVENPVLVEIGTRKNGSYFFRVTDTGVGLDKEGFENTLMCYLTSTKEGDGDSIGYFGLGAKSFLALDRPGTFICRKNGKEYKYLAYQGAEFCEYDLLYEKETSEGDGVIFELDIKDYYERREFVEKATHKLCYYDTVVLMIDGRVVENTIYRQEDFQFSDNYNGTSLHICLKDVLYDIDWNKLGVSPINVAVGLRFGLSDGLVVTPSREGIIMTDKVKKIILEKIKKVAEWFREKYDETVEEFSDFTKAIPHLQSSNKFLKVGDETFYFKNLEPYMSKPCKELSVKGISLRQPSSYFAQMDIMFRNFCLVGQTSWGGSYRTKLYREDFQYIIRNGYRAVLLDQHPVGRVKAYLSEKYGYDTYYFVEQAVNLEFYKQALKLKNDEKETWRAQIQELQEVCSHFRENLFKVEKNIREQQEFIDFVEEKKAEARADKEVASSVYKTLDKKEGEVTIAYGRKALLGNEPVFEKNTYKIDQLYKSPHIILLFAEDEKEEAKKYFGLHKNLKVGVIGKRERTKLPDIHQIMSKEKFEKSKLFRKIVTAMRIEDAIERWDKILNHDESIAEECLEKSYELKEELAQYRRENYTRINMPPEVRESFLSTAKEHNLWDMQILHKVEEFEKALGTFYFLEYIQYPRYGSEEEQKRVKQIINQLLIYQKRMKALDNYQLVQKPVPEEMLQEQYEMDEEFMNSPEAEILLT